ncbi:hypothetical protein SY88_22180 [Clostridiales bacterium PH28_bin88]|nr:hypothetical protein SY88_22180 [Clostridiales bacterium PH28_bin88]
MTGIGYLGPPGTYSEQAAGRWSERGLPGAALVPFDSIPDVIDGVETGTVAHGVLPLENSIEGTVNLTVDLLASHQLSIQGEVVVDIRHCLAATVAGIEEVNEVLSHPQALAQCREYMSRHLRAVSVRQSTSTAEAARMVALSPPGAAAITSVLAAERYGLNILARDIQDYAGNRTRFVAVGKGTVPSTGRDKTSLVLALPKNRPGGLYRALEGFAVQGINLTRIESRPTKKELGDYLFFIDCEGHAEIEPLSTVLRRLEPQTVLLKVLGSYPRDEGG